jgi:hypothetical protein
MDKQLEFVFRVEAEVETPILVGQSPEVGRRQLIPVKGGTVSGPGLNGRVLPGGVDSQVIRPDGRCELSARYALEFDDGARVYIENNGIRTVPREYVRTVLEGGFIDPSLYYFRTTPTFEVYDEGYQWLLNSFYICRGERLPDRVRIDFFRVL